MRRAMAVLEKLSPEQRTPREALARKLATAEVPLVEALRGVGAEVDSVWDLVNAKGVYLPAIPVLVEHIKRDYPHQITEGIARALATRHAWPYWDLLLEVYKTAHHSGPRQGAACAVAAAATEANIRALMEVIGDEAYGSSRVLLMAPLARIGDDKEVVPLLETLAEHPVVGREASKILKRRLARRR